MSALAAKLKEAAANAIPPFELWFDSLDDEDREWLLKVAGNPAISTKKLGGIIRDHGTRIGEVTLQEWREANGLPRKTTR